MRPEESLFIIFVRNRNSDNFRGEVPIVAGNSGVSGSVRRLSTRCLNSRRLVIASGMAISLSVWLFTFSLPTLSSSAFIQHSRITTPRRVTVTSAVVGSKGHDSASGFTFDEIKSIESRLEIIEREAPDLLVAYY